MQQFIPYLSFDGNCREAMQFYAQVFGGTIKAMISFADLPAGSGMPPSTSPRIMHGCLVLPDGSYLYGGDAPEHLPFSAQTGVAITMAYDTVPEALRVFKALCAGGKETMPFSTTFWARGFGMVTDRYGTCWAINGESTPAPA